MVSAPHEGGRGAAPCDPGRVPQPVGDGRLKLAFLGTGAAFSPERYNGAVVVDGRLLLDAGAPLLPHMKRVGVDPGAIEVVFVTHFHGDHTLGLPPFVLYRIFVDRRPIIFVGPAGVEEKLEALFEVSWGKDWKTVMRPRFEVTYQVAQPSGNVAGFKYEAIKLDHGKNVCFGYRISVDDRILAYSGDTEATAPLDELVKDATVAIVEATGPGDVFTHMSWEAAAALKRRHPKTRFLFNHIYSGTIEGAVNDLEVLTI